MKSIPKEAIKAKIAFVLGYGAGMRVSEVANCDPKHFRPNSILVEEGKGGVDRVVPLPRGWRTSFKKNLPLRVCTRTLQRWFKTYAFKCGLSKALSFHSLRHGFATRSIENGVALNQVQLLLGHANIATTSIYTKANPVDALKSYEAHF